MQQFIHLPESNITINVNAIAYIEWDKRPSSKNSNYIALHIRVTEGGDGFFASQYLKIESDGDKQILRQFFLEPLLLKEGVEL